MLTPGLYLCSLLFFVTRIICSHGLCSCAQPDEEFADTVKYIHYDCKNETPATTVFSVTKPQDLLSVLDNNKRTIIYVFGYLQNPSSPDVDSMMNALCYGNTDNVILLDWSKQNTGNYISAFTKAEKIGSLLAYSIRLLKKSGFDVSKLYIIGHSLGSHVAGIAGKCTDFALPRITALDPANPAYYIFGCYLSKTDAEWVDVIHTDMGGYGSARNMGTAEYYVNGGFRPQPGCLLFSLPLSDDDLCSHVKSVELYIATKYRPKEYIAIECPSYVKFRQGNCNENMRYGVGYTASNVQGSFYLDTEVLQEKNKI